MEATMAAHLIQEHYLALLQRRDLRHAGHVEDVDGQRYLQDAYEQEPHSPCQCATNRGTPAPWYSPGFDALIGCHVKDTPFLLRVGGRLLLPAFCLLCGLLLRLLGMALAGALAGCAL